MVVIPREGVRMAGAPLLCPCLWSHLYEGQGLVPKHLWMPGTVLASGGCWVQNRLCQRRTPPARGRSGAGHINKLLWLFSLFGGAEGWPCQVPSPRRCLHGTGSCQSPSAQGSWRWPAPLLWMQLCGSSCAGAIPGHSCPWARRKQALMGFCHFPKDVVGILGNFLILQA